MAKKAKRPTKKESKEKKRAPLFEATPAEAVALAIKMHQGGEFEAAAEIYKQILAAVPNQVDALHFLGVTEHQRGRFERALALIDRAAELAPDHPDIHSNRGNVLKVLHRLDEAEAAYQRALELRPDDSNALSNLGTVMRERGRLDEAHALLRRALDLRPDHYEALQNLGNVLGALHRYDEALDAHREALRLRPASGDSYRQLGGMYYAMGRIAEAADVYRQWLALDPSSPVAAHLLTATTGGDAPARASDAFVRQSFDNYAASFDASLARLEYRAPALVGEAVAAALDAGRALDILDAGCGTGLCAPMLRPYAKRLVGVDLSGKMLERARVRGGYDQLVEAELTAFLGAHAARWDLVVSADTLVYFGGLEEVAAAAARALRAGGALVFTVERSDEGEAPSGFRLHPHGRYSHTEPYLRRTLADAGLDVAQLREVELRKEAGKWVRGSLVVATKPDAA